MPLGAEEVVATARALTFGSDFRRARGGMAICVIPDDEAACGSSTSTKGALGMRCEGLRGTEELDGG